MDLIDKLDKLVGRMRSGTDNDPADTVEALALLLGELMSRLHGRHPDLLSQD